MRPALVQLIFHITFLILNAIFCAILSCFEIPDKNASVKQFYFLKFL